MVLIVVEDELHEKLPATWSIVAYRDTPLHDDENTKTLAMRLAYDLQVGVWYRDYEVSEDAE